MLHVEKENCLVPISKTAAPYSRPLWSRTISTTNGSKTWRHLLSYKNILRSVESVGIEMVTGVRRVASWRHSHSHNQPLLFQVLRPGQPDPGGQGLLHPAAQAGRGVPATGQELSLGSQGIRGRGWQVQPVQCLQQRVSLQACRKNSKSSDSPNLLPSSWDIINCFTTVTTVLGGSKSWASRMWPLKGKMKMQESTHLQFTSRTLLFIWTDWGVSS